MSEDRVKWLTAQIAAARDMADGLPAEWIQEREEMRQRAEELTKELEAERAKSPPAEPEATALDALRALGEAVATVARAMLIGRVAAGRRIDVDMDGDAETGLTLTVFWNGATISRYTSARPGFGRIVTTYSGESEDFAVEAVARLIEEAQR